MVFVAQGPDPSEKTASKSSVKELELFLTTKWTIFQPQVLYYKNEILNILTSKVEILACSEKYHHATQIWP